MREYYDDSDIAVINIGDCARARRIIDGTCEGRNVTYTLEQKGFI